MARPKKADAVVAEAKTIEETTVVTPIVEAKEKLGGKTMAEKKYLVANLVNVKETFVGRGQSVEHTAEMPNGALVHLGELKAGETHIRKAVATKVEGELPFIVAEPEINAAEYTRMDKQLGGFRLKANKPHVAWQLNLHDRIEYSSDFFQDTPAVGDIYEIAYAGAQFGAKKPSATGFVFKVVEVKPAVHPVAYSATYELLPTAYNMIKVEVINKLA